MSCLGRKDVVRVSICAPINYHNISVNGNGDGGRHPITMRAVKRSVSNRQIAGENDEAMHKKSITFQELWTTSREQQIVS